MTIYMTDAEAIMLWDNYVSITAAGILAPSITSRPTTMLLMICYM